MPLVWPAQSPQALPPTRRCSLPLTASVPLEDVGNHCSQWLGFIWERGAGRGACLWGQAFFMPVSAPRGAPEAPSPQGQGCFLRHGPGSRLGMRGPGPGGPSWQLTASPVPSAELLPHLGGLQLQGHEAAFPAEVRVPQLGRGQGVRPPSTDRPPPVSPGPPCWLLWPSWTPSRKWPTWPPTPEVGRARGRRLGLHAERRSGCEPKRTRAQSRDLGSCSLVERALWRASLASPSRSG